MVIAANFGNFLYLNLNWNRDLFNLISYTKLSKLVVPKAINSS